MFRWRPVSVCLRRYANASTLDVSSRILVPTLFEIVGLLGLVAGVGYWLSAMRGKELARTAAARACHDAQVQFLDDTVVLSQSRLRRDAAGHACFERQFRFEFTDGHERRYYGHLTLLGHQVKQVWLGS